MSVFTKVSQSELEIFLQSYEVGQLQSYTGISAGVTNTNYFVTTTGGQYVLTLFEELSAEELPFFLELTAFLASCDIPCAEPVALRNGNLLTELCGKPAALVRKLKGKDTNTPSQAQCETLGTALGRMHHAGLNFEKHRNNNRGPHWWRETIKTLLPKLNASDAQLAQSEIDFLEGFEQVELPRGIIHADLFCDNTLFVDSQLTGIIDFYYACNDVLLYDLAIVVNDWCSISDGSLDKAKATALIQAYTAARSLQPGEPQAWPIMLRAAALRFWLSRLLDNHFPREGEMTYQKDPEVFKRILLQRIEQHDALMAMCSH